MTTSSASRNRNDWHTLQALSTTLRRWEQDARYSDGEAMLDVARILDTSSSLRGGRHD